MLPTAESTGAQSSCFATALVTVSGGGTIFLPMEIIEPIWAALIETSTTTRMTTPVTASQKILRFDFTSRRAVCGLATSCISWLDFHFEQQAPQPARHC